MMSFSVDSFRRVQLATAEWIDAWRLLPRFMVVAYMYMMYKVVQWYLHLAPYVIDNCVVSQMQSCIAEAPTNQHTAFVAAIIGMAATIFGLYTKSGERTEVPAAVIPREPPVFSNRPDDNY